MLVYSSGFAKEVLKSTICFIIASWIFPAYVSINETWMIALLAGVVAGGAYLIVSNIVIGSTMSVFTAKIIATIIYFVGFMLFSLFCPGFHCTLFATLVLAIGLSPMLTTIK